VAMRDKKKKVRMNIKTYFHAWAGIVVYSAYFTCVSLYAQSEPIREFYPDGRLKKEVYEKYGKKRHNEYYPDGQIKYKQKMHSESGEKTATVYYKDGTRKSHLIQGRDAQGNIRGVWKYFGRDGKLESIQILENGAFISTEHFRDHTTISRGGDFKIEILYKKGKWKGRGGNFTRMYDAAGNVIHETPLDETQRM
jgi:antitoxin component YwqK of YwqJK toxin-antitoxin module